MLMFIANISISNNLYIVRILFLFFAFFLGRRCKFKLYFSICTLPLVVNEVTGVPFTVRSVICVSPFPYLMQNRHARSAQTYS